MFLATETLELDVTCYFSISRVVMQLMGMFLMDLYSTGPFLTSSHTCTSCPALPPMPRHLKRKRVASNANGSTMQNGTSTVDKNGLEVEVKTGDLFVTNADIIAFSVDEKLNGPMRDALARTVGNTLFEEAFAKAKTAHKRSVMQGEILPIDLAANPSLPFKFAILVVRPLAPHLKMAYKAILQFAITKNLATIAIPGLGCGGTDVCPTVSSGKLHDVIKEWQGGFKGVPKQLTIVDKVDFTVDAFKAAFGMGAAPSSARRPRRSPRGAVPAGDVNATPEQIVRASTAAPINVEEIDCSVCMESLREGNEEVVQLTLCGHQIHYNCFVAYLTNAQRRACWICGAFFWRPVGNMPQGTMNHAVIAGQSLPGHPDAQGVIQIDYSIRGGVQGPQHLRPGVHFSGTHRTAYLPNNDAGRKVLRLLEKAFECKLTFTVGDSVTSGAQNVVVWNNVHHKTSMHGGPHAYGYPDPGYLERLTEELASLGITEAMLDE
ncbi:hypothetical protein PMAYCL1PPCAC_02807 [Pristionchus mayeri]|uniref:E3 ubiquitin-protein ligase n=1 Tax=Pristionchus mayeri TaxID=1317129 RepID=A0AAN5C7A5_9BILA|nr:hypothetical protein PMAYCL1PPCAC_02807 [Pristionchus mayeri]